MFLLDSDVLIECLRAKPAARVWLAGVRDQRFGVPGVVAMELLAGCRNQTAQLAVQRFTKQFRILWPDAAEFQCACEIMAAHHLSSLQ